MTTTLRKHPNDRMLNFDHAFQLANQSKWNVAIRYYMRSLALRSPASARSTELAHLDQSKARLVELRFCGGCTHQEAAAILGISDSTADRPWAYSRVRLQAYIKS